MTNTIIPVMYVVIRKDIPNIDKEVQGGHVVAKYLIEHLDRKVNNTNIVWNNGMLVYIGIKDKKALVQLEQQLKKIHRPFSTFLETDWSDFPVKTALAFLGTRLEFPELKVLKIN